MMKVVRVSEVIASEARTIRKVGADLEVMDTVQVGVSAWRTSGGLQRWVAIAIRDGEHAGLEVFVPLEAFEKRARQAGGEIGELPGSQLVE